MAKLLFAMNPCRRSEDLFAVSESPTRKRDIQLIDVQFRTSTSSFARRTIEPEPTVVMASDEDSSLRAWLWSAHPASSATAAGSLYPAVPDTDVEQRVLLAQDTYRRQPRECPTPPTAAQAPAKTTGAGRRSGSAMVGTVVSVTTTVVGGTARAATGVVSFARA